MIMFTLRNHEGYVIKMKNGQPFKYTSRAMARLGKKILEKEREEHLFIVDGK